MKKLLFFVSMLAMPALQLFAQCAPDVTRPVANTQNITVFLDASGQVTVNASQVNNGSTDNCPGPLTFRFLLPTGGGNICVAVREHDLAVLTAPVNNLITAINFASYGTPSPNPPNRAVLLGYPVGCVAYGIGSCHAASSVPVISNNAIGRNSSTTAAENAIFGDPCVGTFKSLYINASYLPTTTTMTFNCLQKGPNTVTLAVTDANGNSSFKTAVITVADNLGPTINCPANITVNNTPGQCGAMVCYPSPVVSDNCPPVTPAGYTFRASFGNSYFYQANVGTNYATAQNNAIAAGGHLAVITSAAENNALAASGAGFAWIGGSDQVTEGVWKWVTCEPFSYITWCNGEPNGGTVENHLEFETGGCWNDLNASANRNAIIEIEGAKIIQTAGLPQNAFFPVGTTTNTFVATDAAGNTSTCSFTVTVTDNQLPSITCPVNIVKDNDPGLCGANVTVPAVLVSDNCNVICNTDDIDEYTPGPINGQSPQWAPWFSQPSGLVSSEQFFSAPYSMKIAGPGAYGPTTPDQLFLLGNQTGGKWTLSFKMFVATGHTAQYNIQRFEAPATQWGHQVEFRSNGTGFSYSNAATAFSYPQNQWFDVVQKIDQVANQTSLSINGVLIHTWPFAIGSQANQIGSLDFFAQTNLFSTDPNPAATSLFYIDDITLCGDPVKMGNYIARRYSKYYPVGETLVNIKITDPPGNPASCILSVKVIDSEPPTITCPADLTVQCASQVPLPNPALATASDNCPGVTKSWVADNITPGSCPNRFTVSRIYKATDAAGNSTTCTQTITVFDDTPPTITCPQPVTVQCASEVPDPDVESVTVNDNCGDLEVTWVSDVINNQTCANRYTITRTYRATDACGNSATCTQIITVNDDTPPTIICPAPLTVQCAEQVPLPSPSTVSASDNCGQVTVTWVSDVISNQTCANRYTITRTYRATDVCGNSATCTQIITVNDDTPPTITCPAPVTVQCAGQVPLPSPSTVSASDNCGQVTVTWEGDVIDEQSCANRYFVYRTYKATDACNNSATCVQLISVFDDTPPVITCPGALTVQCTDEVPEPDPTTATASDNCVQVTVTWEGDVISNQTCANRYTITRTYKATDACGNSATCTQTINVFDDTAPTFTCPPNTTIPFTGACTYIANPTNTGSPTNVMDNCGGAVAVTFTDVVADCGYNTVITRTWKATDVCGNSTTCTQTITISDNNTPYVIYASREAKFGEDNDINGDVGVTDANGKADFKKGCVLDPYHVYAKNIHVHMPATVNNKHFVPATGGPNPPFFTYTGGGLSGHHTQGTNGTVPAGNFSHLTIKKGVTAEVNGSNYGKVTIEENASVTFTSSSIDIEDLKVKKGKSPGTTNVYFTSCTGVRVKDKVEIEDDCRVNVGGPKVIFYMGDNKKDDEKFSVKGDNTQVTVNVHMPNGKLKVHGGNGGCIMTGWFLVEKLDSEAKNVTWNRYDECVPLFAPLSQPVVTNEEPIEPAIIMEKVEEMQNSFAATAYPNPSSANFSIVVKSQSLQPITVRVMDMSGNILSVITKVNKGSVINLGSELSGGTYMAEVIQGANRKVIKLVKLN